MLLAFFTTVFPCTYTGALWACFGPEWSFPLLRGRVCRSAVESRGAPRLPLPAPKRQLLISSCSGRPGLDRRRAQILFPPRKICEDSAPGPFSQQPSTPTPTPKAPDRMGRPVPCQPAGGCLPHSLFIHSPYESSLRCFPTALGRAKTFPGSHSQASLLCIWPIRS